MARSIWSGAISFGLVSVPVKVFPAVRRHDVHFHQLDSKGARIRNQKISEKTGKPVDEIQLGYERSKGRYVTFDPDEIAELRPASTKTIDVSEFVDLTEIDPIYFDATSTMRFADEIVPKSGISGMPARRPKVAPKEIALATQIIDALSSEWHPSRYHDTYTEELRDIIERRAKGEEVTIEEAPPAKADVVDLMAALEASVTEANRRSGSPRRRTARSGASKRATKRSQSSRARKSA